MVERKKHLIFLLSDFCELERIKKAGSCNALLPQVSASFRRPAPEAHYRFIRSIKQYNTN